VKKNRVQKKCTFPRTERKNRKKKGARRKPFRIRTGKKAAPNRKKGKSATAWVQVGETRNQKPRWGKRKVGKRCNDATETLRGRVHPRKE